MDFPFADLAPFLAVGFAAQLIDAALGLGFGVISSSLLMVLGVPAAAASAGVHFVETLPTAIQSLAHFRRRDYDTHILPGLLLPGIVGGVLGALVLARLPDEITRPVILGYLIVTALFLIARALRRPRRHPAPLRNAGLLGLVGGFFDASGGGWGPIVASSLLTHGEPRRKAVGTVAVAEFAVTLAIALAFLAQGVGLEALTLSTLAYLAGALLALPLGGVLARIAGRRALLLLVGATLVAAGIYGYWGAIHG